MERVEYVLPLRWTTNDGDRELTRYLRALSGWADVTVVDGSPTDVFDVHARTWSHMVRHMRPTGSSPNGKVGGVLTGLSAARHGKVLVADDDVRYTRETLAAVVRLLDDADVVSPQNHYEPLPWHARWDTARSLVNRAFGHDYPGTFALRASALPDGYRDDVLFENLELLRTVRARGGRVVHADDVFVARRPPTVRHFLGQRIRQAYDSQAQPARLAVELSLLPALALQALRPAGYAMWAALAVVLAAFGGLRAGGSRVFRPFAALWAPHWVLERAFTAWIALALRARGGVSYAGGTLFHAASRAATLPQSAIPPASRKERTP